MRFVSAAFLLLAASACTTQFEDPPPVGQSLGECDRLDPPASAVSSTKRWQLCLSNQSQTDLKPGYQMPVPIGDLALAPGDEVEQLRVERFTSGSWAEIDSDPEVSTNSQLWFVLSDLIPNGAHDGSYFVMLGTQSKPSALIWNPLDDFTGQSLDTAHWTLNGTAATVASGWISLTPPAELTNTTELGDSTAVDYRIDVDSASPNALFGFLGSSEAGIRTQESGEARLSVDATLSPKVVLTSQPVLSVVRHGAMLYGLVDHVAAFDPLPYDSQANATFGVEVLPSPTVSIDWIRARRAIWPPPAVIVSAAEM